MASASPLDKVACRAIIVHEGKLMVVKLRPTDDFYCLPGGSLERWETLQACFEREMEEELLIRPITGKLLFINEGLIQKRDKHILEFFYFVENSKDYLNLDVTSASHAFEISEVKRIDIHADFPSLAPDFVLSELRTIDWNDLENYQTKTIQSG